MKYMRYTFVLLFVVLMPSIAFANQRWQQANELYSEKKYAEAATLYEQLLNNGESAELYYNYANTCYKIGDIGKSILYYERALKLKPHFEDAKANLDFVNSRITDKIEPIQKFFLAQWIENLGKCFTTNQWAVISIISFSLALLLLLIYFFASIRWLRKFAFFAGIIIFLISLSSAAYSFSILNTEQNHPSAIVMVGSVEVKSAPDQSGTELYVLHEGTKVVIKSRLGEWAEIQLSDGSVGWLPQSQIGII